MMGYNIEFYPYLPKIEIYFFLHFGFRSDLEPEPDPDPWKKIPDPHHWYYHIVIFRG